MVRVVRGVVCGRVQRVAYRASFQRKSVGLGLCGWVRNRPDGAVEFFVQGPADDVQAILEWARVGPKLARVTEMSIRAADFDPALTGFEIR